MNILVGNGVALKPNKIQVTEDTRSQESTLLEKGEIIPQQINLQSFG